MITTLYAAILAILYIALTAWVIQARYRYKVGLGDGGVPALARCIRIHANFAEYVPFALLLLLMVDYVQTSPVIIHVLGVMLVLGRILHVIGVSRSSTVSFGRAAGMILTVLVMAICAILLLWNFFALRLITF